MFGLRKPKLKMIWQITSHDRTSFIIGAAHFFPHSFKYFLERLVRSVNTVVLESDIENAMNDSFLFRYRGRSHGKFRDLIDKSMEIDIVDEIGYFVHSDILPVNTGRILLEQVKGDYPWRAYLLIWGHFLRKLGWTHCMELDILKLARTQGKNIVFLESLDAQLDTLSKIPSDRIQKAFKLIRKWRKGLEEFKKAYLKGDLHTALEVTSFFPTRCKEIIDDRNIAFHQKIKPLINSDNCLIAVGIAHMPGLLDMLKKDGYEATQLI